jgi:hypothetical protein
MSAIGSFCMADFQCASGNCSSARCRGGRTLQLAGTPSVENPPTASPSPSAGSPACGPPSGLDGAPCSTYPCPATHVQKPGCHYCFDDDCSHTGMISTRNQYQCCELAARDIRAETSFMSPSFMQQAEEEWSTVVGVGQSVVAGAGGAVEEEARAALPARPPMANPFGTPLGGFSFPTYTPSANRNCSSMTDADCGEGYIRKPGTDDLRCNFGACTQSDDRDTCCEAATYSCLMPRTVDEWAQRGFVVGNPTAAAAGAATSSDLGAVSCANGYTGQRFPYNSPTVTCGTEGGSFTTSGCCADVANAGSNATYSCTSGVDTRISGCVGGHFKTNNGTGTPDTCTPYSTCAPGT